MPQKYLNKASNSMHVKILMIFYSYYYRLDTVWIERTQNVQKTSWKSSERSIYVLRPEGTFSTTGATD